MDNDVHMDDCPKSDEEFPTQSQANSSGQKCHNTRPHTHGQPHRQTDARMAESITHDISHSMDHSINHPMNSSLSNNPSAFLLNSTNWTNLVNGLQNPIQVCFIFDKEIYTALCVN